MTTRKSGAVRVEVTQEALSQPQFIVKSGDVYYLTLAVWEYDSKALGATTEQKAGVQEIKALFDRLANTPAQRSAVEILEWEPISDQHTVGGGKQ